MKTLLASAQLVSVSLGQYNCINAGHLGGFKAAQSVEIERRGDRYYWTIGYCGDNFYSARTTQCYTWVLYCIVWRLGSFDARAVR